MPGRANVRKRPRSGHWLPIITIVATLGAMGATALGALDGLSGDAKDGLVRVRNAGKPAPSTVVLIDVDARTAAKQGGLPIPRRAYAQAIRRLDALGARAIAIDVQFTEPSSSAADDEALLRAIEDTDVPVVLATSVVAADGDTDVLGGRQNLDPAGAVAAHSAVRVDSDDSMRRVLRSYAGLDTLAQATAKAVGEPGLRRQEALLDPTIPGGKLARISLQDLITRESLGRGEDRSDRSDPSGSSGRSASSARSADPDGRAADRAVVSGRVAVIGVTAVGSSGDDDQTIAGSSSRIVGVEAQAQAIDTVLRGAPLHDGGRTLALLLALVSGLLAALGTRRRMRVQLGAVALTGVLASAIAIVAVKLGLLIDPTPAIVALVLGGTGAAAVRAAAERSRRAAARTTLARFVPPGIVDEVLDEDGLLAPQAQTATVVFCDLRGYTSLVAGLERPESLITVLDAYLSAVTATVHAHSGTVVSFQGDGVMCAFGVPVPSDQSAAQAIAAARDLQAVALPQVVAELADVLPGAKNLALGVGVATGTVFAGTVGPPARREYAVVGPTTNLAARLQALTKTEHVGVITDDATAQAVGTGATQRAHVGIDLGPGGLRPLGPREIRGLPRPIDLWTLAPDEA